MFVISGIPADLSRKTYQKNLIFLDEKAYQDMVQSYFGQGLTQESFSTLDDHGQKNRRYYKAQGIPLKELLGKACAGNYALEEPLTFKDRQGHRALISNLGLPRYFYDKQGNILKQVEPLLAYKWEYSLEDDFSALKEGPAQIPYPVIMFGQREPEDNNKCSFVKDVCSITRGESGPDLSLSLKEGAQRCFKVAELMLMGHKQRSFMVNGQKISCFGVDLKTFFQGAGCALNESGEYLSLKFKPNPNTSICEQKIKLEREALNDYFLAWYSYNETLKKEVSNQTGLRLYGHNLDIPNLSGIIFEPGKKEFSEALYPKKPSTKVKEIISASFYICVKNKQEKLFYYFSADELVSKYPLASKEYLYNNHGLAKATACKGVLLTDILKSLCDTAGNSLALSDSWKLQYLEEDAFHTNNPTYIHTLGEVARVKTPVLTFQIQEKYLEPDIYHHNDDAYKNIEGLCVYCWAGSAGEAVIKKVLGFFISREGEALAPAGYTLMAKNKGGKTLFSKTVKGALPGMQMAVMAPQVPGCHLDKEAPVKLIQAGDPDKQIINFRYKETAFFKLIHKDGAVEEIKLSRLIQKNQLIPGLDRVISMVEEGKAVCLTDENTSFIKGKLIMPESSGNIYLDKRSCTSGTLPYGFGGLCLCRYYGCYLRDLLDDPRLRFKLDEAVDLDGVKAEDCFVAYMQTESKGIPFNTSDKKRRSSLYQQPKLINCLSGRVLAANFKQIIFI